MIRKNKNSHTRKILLLLGAIVLLAGLGFGYTNYVANRTDDQITTVDDSGINYGPPTENEQKEADIVKDTLPDEGIESSPQPSDNQTKRTVTPIISYAGQEGSIVEVNGYVSGIIERGGTCTLYLKKSGVTVTKSKQSLENVQDTSCGLFEVPVSELSKGVWQATLGYDSSKASGTSDVTTIEVK
ncbi:MAG: hypothetical protein M3Q36_03885 [bacterium]|nr:hypothetical protein [bacterium]